MGGVLTLQAPHAPANEEKHERFVASSITSATVTNAVQNRTAAIDRKAMRRANVAEQGFGLFTFQVVYPPATQTFEMKMCLASVARQILINMDRAAVGSDILKAAQLFFFAQMGKLAIDRAFPDKFAPGRVLPSGATSGDTLGCVA